MKMRFTSQKEWDVNRFAYKGGGIYSFDGEIDLQKDKARVFINFLKKINSLESGKTRLENHFLPKTF